MKWSSRKLWIAVGFESLWALMTYLGTLDGDHLETLTVVTIGGYFAGNVGEHLARK